MKQLLLAAVVAALYVLHQDVWFWDQARPLTFGFLPVGLAYHAAYCVAVAVLMWTLTTVAWPAQLESAPDETAPVDRTGASQVKTRDLRP